MRKFLLGIFLVLGTVTAHANLQPTAIKIAFSSNGTGIDLDAKNLIMPLLASEFANSNLLELRITDRALEGEFKICATFANEELFKKARHLISRVPLTKPKFVKIIEQDDCR